MTQLQTIGVLGLGTMGTGIAEVIAVSGRNVIAVDTDPDQANQARKRIDDLLIAAVERGKISTAECEEAAARVSISTTFTQLAGVDAVIESITEDHTVKAKVLGEVAQLLADDVPILSNTSALSITELAAGLANPERVAGLHFFNPAPALRTIEIVRGLQTSEGLVETLVAFVESLGGKTPIVVDDRPGFLINALLLPYLNDVIGEFDEELATAEDIDLALRLGLGYKRGPLEMLDQIGLDVHLHATQAAYEATGDARYAPPPLLRRMVAAGHLGAKSGAGFRTQPQSEKE